AVRQFVERNKVRPFAVIGSSVVGHAAVTALANRDAPRPVVTDVPVNIGVYKILSWPGVMTESFGELLPVAGAVRIENSRGLHRGGIKRRPTQGITRSVLLDHNWPMPRHRYLQGLSFGDRAE